MEAKVQRLALRPKDAAAMLSVSTRTLYELTRRGLIPCIRTGPQKGAAKLYRVCDLEVWLAQAARKEGGAR